MPSSKELMRNWILEHTKGCTSVVDFGCMFGDRFKMVGKSVINRIGIEIWEPYLKAPHTTFTPVHGDMRDFEKLVDKKFFDCALFIDTIEHIRKEEGIALLTRAKELFNVIIIITPNGFFEWTKDVMGFGADESQTHKSTWTEDDLKSLGFSTIVHKGYNPPIGKNTLDCLFGVWKNDKPNIPPRK